jgi:hypothetical protein
MQRSLLDPPQDPQDPPDTRVLHKHIYQDNDSHKEYPGGPLLYKAARKLKEPPITSRRDRFGIICLVYKKFVLVARRYIYRDIVSIHSTIVNYCKTSDKIIIMYIDSIDEFYLLQPNDIINNLIAVNNRGGYQEQSMMNFPIIIGKIIDKEKMGVDDDKKTQTKITT